MSPLMIAEGVREDSMRLAGSFQERRKRLRDTSIVEGKSESICYLINTLL